MAKTYLEIEQEDGSILRFKKEKIKAHWIKEVFKMEKKISELGRKGNYADALDMRIDFVVSLFNDPNLTPELVYNGVDSDKIVEELDRITGDIVGKTEEKTAGES